MSTKLDRVRESARNRMVSERAQTSLGFAVASLGAGALGPQGKAMIPAEIAGVDSDLVLGGLLFFYGRRGTSKRHAQARGASYAFLAGGLRDLGASLATRF